MLKTALCGILVLLSVSLTCTSAVARPQSEAIQQHENSGSAERASGLELYKQNKFVEAEKEFQKAVRLNKTDYEAWYLLGATQLRLKDPKNGTKSFERALELHADFLQAYIGLSYALIRRNKTKEAVRAAQAALEINPDIPDPYYVIGAAHLRDDEQEEALKYADEAIKHNPQFAAAYLLKSQALVSFFGDVLVVNQGEADVVRRSRYLQAAEALETYMQLQPAAEDNETWKEQLEGLRFYSAMDFGVGEIHSYSGADVTKKARVLRKPEPEYSVAALNNQVTGKVVLRCIFMTDGTVKHILVIKGLPGLTEQAIKASRKIVFVPAEINGKALSMHMQLEYNFNLY